MTTRLERRVVREVIPVTDEPVTIAQGGILAVFAHRDYPEDIAARRLHLWIETTVEIEGELVRGLGLPDRHIEGIARPVEHRRILIIGTEQPVPVGASWITSVLDGPIAWHLYQAPTEPPPGRRWARTPTHGERI